MQPQLPETVDLILYHAECADGFGAAWALHRKYGDGPEYRPLHYAGKLDPADVEGKVVLMVDVSLPREQIVELHARAKSFLLIDHHKTALENLEGLPGCYLDMKRSGAGLAWDIAHPDVPRPPLINLVETRDLWQWDRDPNAAMLCRALDAQPRQFQSWDAFNKRMEIPTLASRLLDEARAMQQQYEATIQALAKDAIPVVLEGRRGFAVCVPHIFASDVGNLLSRREGGDFGFTWCTTADGQKVRASWRTNPDNPPVRGLAESFGGGGHPNAAGAVIEFDQLRQILASSSALDAPPPGKDLQANSRGPRLG